MLHALCFINITHMFLFRLCIHAYLRKLLSTDGSLCFFT